MRQHQSDQQGLLFAGRGVASRHVLGRVDHLQIGEMRAIERTPCHGIARAAIAQDLPVTVLYRCGRLGQQRVLHPAVEHDLGGREGGGIAPRAQHRCQSCRGLTAGGGDGHRKLSGLALDRVTPMVVVVAHLQ